MKQKSIKLKQSIHRDFLIQCGNNTLIFANKNQIFSFSIINLQETVVATLAKNVTGLSKISLTQFSVACENEIRVWDYELEN